ncbi:carcinoembryonic antigen-related cell adhesion molecule 5-like [Labeo rohita]|uniref:carcinoembryonic antigen-related cell adhesion molecule 5-like n=1 Tax=Labeo rohita TaxID=84645 RepID=UPI0021E28045|nr:carcinoembryonic antigen-related cell adhesion molecule 5-like [Labeo rohita]
MSSISPGGHFPLRAPQSGMLLRIWHDTGRAESQLFWILELDFGITAGFGSTLAPTLAPEEGVGGVLSRLFERYKEEDLECGEEKPKPVVRVHPDKNVFSGEKVTLTCDIQQTGDWRYSWYKDRNQNYIIGQTQNYVIPSVDSRYGGVYSCTGSQSKAPRHSDRSEGVTLTVSDLPTSTLTVTPDSPVFTGETVNLKCVIKPDHSDWRYEWYKGNQYNPMLQTSDHYTVNGDTISVVKTIASDQDHYWCRGQRDERPKSSHFSINVYLYVKDLPTSTLTVTPDSPVFTGETVKLKCVIESYRDWIWRNSLTYERRYDWTPEWRYEWYKGTDSVMLQTSDHYIVNKNTLTIRGATESDQGQYWCRGQRDERPQSSQSSSKVSLTVTDLPTSTLTVTPDSPVFTGETVNLKCVIESHSNWRYEWYKGTDSVMLQMSDRYTVNKNTLTIRGATESDKDQYWCRGQRDKIPKSSQSRSKVSLTVMERPKPVVKVTPDQRVFRGETVTLTCDIQGGGNIQWTYSWFKDGSVIRHVTERVYTITSVSDSGEYSCRGQRSDSQRSDISAAVTLTVSDLPTSTLTVTPDSPVFTGETVNMKCVIESDVRNWKYEWYKGNGYNSVMLQTSEHYTVNADTLTIRGAITSDHDSPTSTLTVTPDSPVFTGETVNMTCVIESYSDWRYEWYKGNRYNSVILQTSERFTVNGDTLIIKGVITYDQDQYWCTGQRDKRPNKSQSSTVSFIVTERPKPVVKVTPDQRVFRGETVTLTCDIQGGGNIQWTYSWFKDGSVIRHVTERVYTITSVSDSGEYSCRGERSDSQRSDISAAVTLTVSGLKPKPELTSDPAGAALTGNTVTLTCRMDPSTGWDFYWYKHTLNPETKKTETNSYRVKIDSVSDGGQYWCRAGRGKPVYYTQYSDALWVNVTVSPKAVVTVRPDERVFRGETVTLRCDIKWGGDTEWTYRWEIEGTNDHHKNSVSQISTQELNISSVDHFHSGKYTCTGQKNTQSSQRSDAVTLNVSAEAQAAVRVSPQPWLTEGDSVTLICEVTGSSTGWTFSWFRDDDHLSDSSRGAGGSYTLSPAALQHTGVYTCRAERGRPAYYTNYSNTQPLWITGESV